MSNPPSPSEIGRLWFGNVWNERDHELARRLMAEDVIGHLEGGLKVVGQDAFFAFQAEFFAAMPDLKIDVLETLSADCGVCVRWQATGTHSGPAWGMVPSENVVTFEGVSWFHTKDGRITEGRDFWNLGGLMQNYRCRLRLHESGFEPSSRVMLDLQKRFFGPNNKSVRAACD